MTKNLQIISDVHSEFGVTVETFTAFLKIADITVLAGDIVNSASKLAPYLKACKKFSPSVIFVCGNHEYYKGNTDEEYEKVCEQEKVVFLQRKRILIDGFWFCGATLWSNISDEAKKLTNDPFTASKIREIHTRDREWLKENIEEGDIVVTHHMPSLKLIHPKYGTTIINSAFATNLEDIIIESQPELWICGHTHTKFDINVKNTRLVINPVGYPGENTTFEPKIVTIGYIE